MRQDQRAVLAHTVANNVRYPPATHLDMILMDITGLDVPGNAAIAGHFPARLRLDRRLKIERECQDDDRETDNRFEGAGHCVTLSRPRDLGFGFGIRSWSTVHRRDEVRWPACVAETFSA